MKHLPKTVEAPVIRTYFENQEAWETICGLIRAPVEDYGVDYFAYVAFVDDPEFRNLSKEELLERVPADFNHGFLMVVDEAAAADPEFPVLVIDLYKERGRAFRAVPREIQGIENNFSISNMDFADFADNVDADGVFRGFKR